MAHRTMLALCLSLLVNLLVCCTVMPFFIPPFRGWAPSQLLEVALWQSMAFIGWPLALAGIAMVVSFDSSAAGLDALAPMLVYPVFFLLLIRIAVRRRFRLWEALLLNALVAFSFAVIWHAVLNGYDFMSG